MMKYIIDGYLTDKQQDYNSAYEDGVNSIIEKYKTSKRELFAAMAMQGILSSDAWSLNLACQIAERSVDMADELLKALEQNNDS